MASLANYRSNPSTAVPIQYSYAEGIDDPYVTTDTAENLKRISTDIYNQTGTWPTGYDYSAGGTNPDTSTGGLFGSLGQGLKDAFTNKDTGGLNFNSIGSGIMGLAKLGTNIYNIYNSNRLMKTYRKQQDINNRISANNWNAQADQDYYNKANAGNGLLALMGNGATSSTTNSVRNNIDNSRIYHVDSNARQTTQPTSMWNKTSYVG